MEAINGDLRRYAWTRGQALWRMSMPLPALLEDARGAHAEHQLGLLRHTARNLGRTCAAVIALRAYAARPLPASRVAPAWSLDVIDGHPLAAACAQLIDGDAALDADALLACCEQLAADVEALVGRTPDPMSPEGYFPAMARAREWLRLADVVGEEGFLPAEWTAAF